MKLIDEAGVVAVSETAWRSSLVTAGIAGGALVQAGHLGPAVYLVVGVLVLQSYFSAVRRSWTFDESRGTFVARRRFLLHAGSKRLPLHELRRVVAEPIGKGEVVLLTLIHSGGTLRFRNGSSSNETDEVKAIVKTLQDRFGLGPGRFTDMQIIQEARGQASEIATIGVIKLLKGWGLKESRDWLKAGMPERDE